MTGTVPEDAGRRAPDPAALVRAWLLAWAALVHDASGRLTKLDAAIGDGDHGINLDRGLRLLAARLPDPDLAALPAPALLVATGRLLLGSVGGASGALYGRALMRAGGALEDALAVSRPGIESRVAGEGTAGGTPGLASAEGPGAPAALAPVIAPFDAAVASIAQLGRSAAGDKTMLDALIPAADALRAGAREGLDAAAALARAAAAAERGAEATRPLVARRGRASYLGERSAGHLDPGAASASLLVTALAETFATA